MSKVYAEITPDHQTWIAQQQLFFVATAPLSEAGHINCSPKGMDSFRVLGPQEVAYVDLTGSGAETIAHLQENGRIVIMFCGFTGAPQILRLHGHGHVYRWGTPEAEPYAAQLPQLPGARAIIRVEVTRVADSCGYAVPRFDYQGDRETLITWAQNKGPEGLEQYQQQKNTRSIDGLTAL